jgi:hypothetical protein
VSNKEDIKSLMAHLEDEYRNSKISEKSYKELKDTYTKQLEGLEKGETGGQEQDNQEKKEEIKEAGKGEEHKEKKGLLGGLFHRKHDEEAAKPEKEGSKEEKKEETDEEGEVKMYGTGTLEDPYRTTPEIQQPQEEVEVKEEKTQAVQGDMNTAIQIELEKTKAIIDNLREMKQATDETIRQMSESIGEIRSMVFQSDGNLKEMEMKVEKIEDDMSDVKPSEISKKFKEINAVMETAQINIEKLDKKLEDITTKVNETYDMLKGIGGLENIIDVNKNIQKKVEEMNELSKYVERLSLKIEKVFVDINKNLDDFVSYKIKQDGMFDSLNELVKNFDGVNIKFEGYATKKDFQTLEEDLIVIKKQIEDISKALPMIKINLPEPILEIRKGMDDIHLLLNSVEEQYRNGKIRLTDYNKIRDINKKKLEEMQNEIKDEWNRIISSLKQRRGEEVAEPTPATETRIETAPIEVAAEQKVETRAEEQKTEEVSHEEMKPEMVGGEIEKVKEEPVKKRRTKKEMQEERMKEEIVVQNASPNSAENVEQQTQ